MTNRLTRPQGPRRRCRGNRALERAWSLPRRRRSVAAATVLALTALTAHTRPADAAPGFASAYARSLWVLAADSTVQAAGAPASKATRTGLWLDVDGGARRGQHGMVWGARLGWTGAGATRADALVASAVGGAARFGVARSVLGWNRLWAGELAVTADLWAAYDTAAWYSTGLRAAPRLGLRLLLGYGAPVRGRLRLDLAPALAVATAAGVATDLSGVWLRLGVDVGPVTVGAWARMIADLGWANPDQAARQDVSAGLSVGLRVGRGGAR